MKIKIAVIGTRGLPATYGGIEKHCEELYSGLVKKGCEVTVYSRKYYTQEQEYKGIKIKSIPIFNVKGFEALICSFLSTISATFSDADIIHFHAQGPTLFSWIPRFFASKKIIGFTCHGIDWQRDKWGLSGKFIIKLGEIASVKYPHFRIAVSQDLVDYYNQKHKVKLHKIYNGINIQKSRPLNKFKNLYNLSENGYFLFVGRLVPEKAPEILIKAMKNLETDKKLVIVGDSAGTDDYVAQLKHLAKDDSRIIFTSYLYGDDLTEIYSNAFAYISASKLEGLPLTVLEAMSYKKPIILSNIAPHAEILELDNSCGKLFMVNNCIDCTNSMRNMLKLTDIELEKTGVISQNIVLNHFQWQNIIDSTEKLYFNMISK